MPWPVLVLAIARDRVLRAAADRAALAGAVGRRVAYPVRQDDCARRCGSRSCARCGRPACRRCSACRWRGCWPVCSSRAAAPCGRCARCRWCCHRWSAASRCSSRSAGADRRAVPRSLVRLPAAVHDGGCRHGPDVRRDAVPRDHRRGRAATARPRFEDASRTLGGVALVHVPSGHAAGDPPRARSPVRCWPGLVRSASSVRRSRSPATFPARTQTMPLARLSGVGDRIRRRRSC